MSAQTPGYRGPVLSVTDLRVESRDAAGASTIVSGLDIEIQPGESVAFVGESGSGKSVTAKAITGLLPRGLTATGTVALFGRNLLGANDSRWQQVRGGQVGMIMQDPFTTLNPILRCGDIIAETLLVDGKLTRSNRRQEVTRRLAEVGIDDPSVADRYPFQLSGGMRQRVGIAATLARDPQLLIADEPTTALDVTTQRGILELIKKIQAARQMSLILITHDLRVGFAMCERVHVLYAGSVVETAATEQLDAEPLHPYTAALLQSEPPPDKRLRELVSIPGSVPSPDDVAGGCVFATRCSWVADICTSAAPPLQEVAPGRWSACVRLDDIRTDLAARLRQADEAAAIPPPSEGVDPVIRVEAVSKVFGTKSGPVQALDDVSLWVADGECVGVVGESGSGKTTLARMLIGLETATSGSITIGGRTVADPTRPTDSELRAIRSSVQMVFQDPYSSLNPRHRVGRTLAEAIRTHHPKTPDVRAEVTRLLDQVGLPATVAGRRPAALSGGMRQRVAIGRALAARPRVLICDESVSALDVSVQAQILNLLIRLGRERELGILFITHDLSVVRQIADRLYVMHRGRVVESGPTDQVLQSPADSYTIELLRAAPRADSDWLAGVDQPGSAPISVHQPDAASTLLPVDRPGQ